MGIGNVIDKAVGVINPEAGLKRTLYREKMKVFKIVNKGYDEHGASRRKKALKGMNADSGTADEDIGENHEILVKRSRSLWQGSTVATAAIKNIATNAVGTGLKAKPSVDYEYLDLNEDQKTEIEKIIEREYQYWSKNCGLFREESFEEVQNLVMLSQLMSGDVFVLLPVEKDGYLKLQAIEGDQIGAGLGSGGADIKNGVELQNGRVVAYHIKQKNMQTKRITLRGGTSQKRNILHIMLAERPAQRRGVPYLAHVIEDLKQLDRYQKAELHAAVIASFFTVFIETPDIIAPFGEGGGIPAKEQVDKEDESTLELGQGNIMALDKGEKASVVNPARQNASFDSFVTSICRNIGAALEIPFESLLKHFSSSYSASRAALLELWKFVKYRRYFLIKQFCNPVYEQFIDLLVYSGKLPHINKERYKKDPLYREALYKCMWYGPSQGQIDPLKEVVAAEKRINLGITTRTQETMEMNGGDWEKNAEQLRKEKEIIDNLGIINNVKSKEETVQSVEDGADNRGGKRKGAGRKKENNEEDEKEGEEE